VHKLLPFPSMLICEVDTVSRYANIIPLRHRFAANSGTYDYRIEQIRRRRSTAAQDSRSSRACSCSCSSLENCTFFRKKYHSYSMNTRTCICVLFPSFFVFMFVFKYGPRGLCAVHFEQFKLCSGERTNTSGGVLPSCSFSSFTLEEESDVGSVVSHVRKDRTQT